MMDHAAGLGADHKVERTTRLRLPTVLLRGLYQELLHQSSPRLSMLGKLASKCSRTSLLPLRAQLKRWLQKNALCPDSYGIFSKWKVFQDCGKDGYRGH